MEALARHKTIEEVATLFVTGRTKRQVANCAGLHGVIVFLMGSCGLAKFDAAVFFVVDMKTGHNGAWAERL
jgi:hypothetical protein